MKLEASRLGNYSNDGDNTPTDIFDDSNFDEDPELARKRDIVIIIVLCAFGGGCITICLTCIGVIACIRRKKLRNQSVISKIKSTKSASEVADAEKGLSSGRPVDVVESGDKRR